MRWGAAFGHLFKHRGRLFYPKVQWMSGGSWNPLSSARNSVDPAGLTVVGMGERDSCVWGEWLVYVILPRSLHEASRSAESTVLPSAAEAGI